MVYKTRMHSIASWVQRARLPIAVALTLIPAIVFYISLWSNAVGIPILDDYQIILGLLNRVSELHSISAALSSLFLSEHNGYKLIFENAVVLVQYVTCGQLHLLTLVHFGNAFPIAIFLTVVAMSRIEARDAAEKLLLLAPLAWLLFQLQYASALDFASSSLQHLAVIFFSLFSIFLLQKTSRAALLGACAALALAVASSPNGFFAGPAGLLLLAQDRRWKRAAAWSVSGIVFFAAYLFDYHPDTVQAHAGGASPAHLTLTYALSFVGASAARYASVTPSVLLGAVLCGIFVWATVKRYYRRNPAVYYSMVWILINAVAVSGLRSDLGVAQSLASRYRLYSALFLAFTYMFAIENLPWRVNAAVRLARYQDRRVVCAFALVFSVAFCTLSDLAGTRFLRAKKLELTYNYRIDWQGRSPARLLGSSGVMNNPALRRQLRDGVFATNVPVLREAVRNGVYSPPENP